MKARRRNSHLELRHAHAGTHFVTNLHWTMARRLLRELRDLMDLEFAELYAEADAERVRRLGPRAGLDFPGAAVTEAGPTPCEGRKFSSVQFGARMRAARGMEREVVASWSTQSASKRPSAAAWTPTPPTVPASRHSAEEDGERPAAEGSRQQARQRARAAKKARSLSALNRGGRL